MIVTVSEAVTAARSTTIAWRSSSTTVRVAPCPGELPDASDRRAQSTVAVPVVLRGAPSPANVSTCTAVPLPDRLVTARPSLVPSTTAYAESDDAKTGSLYRIVALLGPDTAPDTIRGASPSATLMDRAAGALPAASAMPPAAGAAYDSVALGRVPFRLPLRVRLSAARPPEASWLEATARPLASGPDTDQPAPPVPCANTVSSNATRIVSPETATLPASEGAWPSSRTATRPPPASAAPSGPDIRSASIATMPVALAGAGSPSKEITWTADAGLPPASAAGVRPSPPTVSAG